MKLAFAVLCHLTLIVVGLSVAIKDDTKLNLELVQVIFRHGERTPLKIEYATYNYSDLSLYEPYGLEHLTNQGKRQAYNVGSLLRDKYKDFLGPDSNASDVYAYASENSRTKTSLQLVLAGLFGPASVATWHPSLKWTPVSYRCVPKAWDIVLNPDKNQKYKNMKNEAKTSAEFKAGLESHLDICKFVLAKPFVDKSNPDILSVVSSVYNSLHSNEAMKLPMPDWYTSEVKESHAKLFQFMLDVESFTPEMRKLNGGVLIKQFLANIKLNERNSEDRKKLYLYSGHDLNIAAVQRSMGVKDPVLPDFASALVVEQYRDERDNKVYVKSFYWDTLRNTNTSLKLDGCDELCRIDNYEKILENVIPTDDECREFLGDDLDSGVMKRLYADFFSNG